MFTTAPVRISVVVISYNLERYIGQAIESVLHQTRQADEIIVVDDCSTDATADRIRSFGMRVTYLRTPRNSGALVAGLTGVKAAMGDVVAMLDGDDVWAPNKLEVVEREFEADPALVLLSHDHVRVDEDGAELRVVDDTHRNIAALRRRARDRRDLSRLLRETVLDQRGYWLGSAYSFRRGLFDVAKFEQQIAAFPADALRNTYLDLTIAPFLVLTNPGASVGYAPDTRFFYRVHGSASMAANLTAAAAGETALKGKTINELIDLLLRSNGASAPHLRHRKFILDEYDFLAALYARKLTTAGRLYLRLASRYWTRHQLKKETMRFAAVALLGTERFLALKQKA